MLKKLSIAFIGSAFLLASGYASAHSVNDKHHHQAAPSAQFTVLFSNNDRSNINRYYGNHYDRHYTTQHRHEKRAHAKHRKNERRFKRRYAMPNQMHYTRLPADLERRLSPLPRDYIRIRVGDEIGIMNTRTRIIYDAVWFIN